MLPWQQIGHSKWLIYTALSFNVEYTFTIGDYDRGYKNSFTSFLFEFNL